METPPRLNHINFLVKEALLFVVRNFASLGVCTGIRLTLVIFRLRIHDSLCSVAVFIKVNIGVGFGLTAFIRTPVGRIVGFRYLFNKKTLVIVGIFCV